MKVSCKEVVSRITDDLEGALTPTEKRPYDDHVASCIGCQRYVQQMRDTVTMLRLLRHHQSSRQ